MNETKHNGSGLRKHSGLDETYKRHAVELTLRGDRTIRAVAEELGISTWVLYRWRKHYGPPQVVAGLPAARQAGVRPGPRTPEEIEEENRRLRAEVLRLREREIVLKKSLGILSETPERGMPGSKR